MPLNQFLSQGLGMMTSVVMPVFDSNDTVSRRGLLVSSLSLFNCTRLTKVQTRPRDRKNEILHGYKDQYQVNIFYLIKFIPGFGFENICVNNPGL